ncbi:unnamed protein product [Sphagnum balticum]
MTFLQMVSAHAGPLVASAEVVRRMVWGWLRMEYEHIELFGQPEKVSSALPSPGPKISYDSSTKSFTMVGADLEAFDKLHKRMLHRRGARGNGLKLWMSCLFRVAYRIL